jgi:uncharacterized protein
MTQPALSTTPNAGMPIAALRKKAQDAIAAGANMTPEDWRGLAEGFLKFIGEESNEPEHAEDEDEGGIAAGIVFCDPEGSVLLLKRASTEENYGDHWALPGGKGEAGETPEQAADREAGEEIGEYPKGEKKLLSSVETPTGMTFHTFHQRVPEQFKPKLNAEHSDYVWRTLDNLPEPLHPGVAKVFESMNGNAAGATDESIDGVQIDREHDGPWMSCMSVDGHTMYVNKNLPREIEIAGKTVDVDKRLLSHEVPERKDLENQIQDFETKNERQPDTEERKAIYQRAHLRSGVPGERAHIESEGGDADGWNAWCRGEETKLEKGPFTNEPDDADVKPIPHGHGDLAATDSALKIALDRDSVRETDRDGRMRVKSANISKACVNPYVGHEIPGWQDLGLDPNKIYKLLRDPEELEKAAPTFNGIQLLKKHVPVNADDGQKWDVVGTTGSHAEYDEPYLRNSLFVWTKDGIDLIESEDQKELSCGYHYKPDMTPGDFNGTSYDGVMRSIVGNHVALVKDGRAGPDVVVGDSKETLLMATPTKPTRIANIACQLTARAVRPILAKDAKIDLMPVFKDVTSKNFNSKTIMMALDGALKGKLVKLANDAEPSMGHVAQLMDHIGGVLGEKGADESVSEEQHKAMEAAAHGESKLGIPPEVGKEFSSADKGKKFDALPEFLKGKGMGDDDIQEVMDAVNDAMLPKNALDAEETEEEKKKKREEEEAKKKEESQAHDAAITTLRTKMATMIDKPAMDAAIKLATDATAKAVRATERAIRQAETEVADYVGKLSGDLTFDSAEDVYRTALKMRNVPDAETLPGAALAPMLRLLPKVGQQPRHQQQIAQDSAGDDFAKRHPEIAAIQTI